MVLVTGANGHLGKATIDFLLKKNLAPDKIIALVRDSRKAGDLIDKGVIIRIGDYFDYSSLVTAFEGVDVLMLISSASMQNRTQQHINVIEAAKQKGVKHIVYTSMLKVTDKSKFIPAIDHYETEEYLKTADIPFTILRNTFYAELLPIFFGDALHNGNWYYAADNAKANFAARTDMAEALANVLLNPSKHINRTYEITSGNAYSFSEIAGIVSKSSGKQFSYTSIPVEALKTGMKQAGVPETEIPVIASVAEAISAGELNVTDISLENLLGRKPVDLKEYLPQLLNNIN